MSLPVYAWFKSTIKAASKQSAQYAGASNQKSKPPIRGVPLKGPFMTNSLEYRSLTNSTSREMAHYGSRIVDGRYAVCAGYAHACMPSVCEQGQKPTVSSSSKGPFS